MGLSQANFARLYGVGRVYVLNIESGSVDLQSHTALYKDVDRFFSTAAPVGNHELCLILRRRYGLTQSEAAKQFGKSKNWVSLMELGEADCQDYFDFLSNKVLL